jgi:hypothetical protein
VNPDDVLGAVLMDQNWALQHARRKTRLRFLWYE